MTLLVKMYILTDLDITNLLLHPEKISPQGATTSRILTL